jgi:hypothetical protein
MSIKRIDFLFYVFIYDLFNIAVRSYVAWSGRMITANHELERTWKEAVVA